VEDLIPAAYRNIHSQHLEHPKLGALIMEDLIPAAYRNTHSQHLEHPKLGALIMFMLEWEPMCRDCYWWRDKNCD
jgi:hypothetical protein